jgi:PAS domain S-box-containing protein
MSEKSKTKAQLAQGLQEARERIARLEQLEKALSESEKRHRTILKTVLDGFCLADADGRLLQVNEMYCQITGYTETELMGMSVADLEAVDTPEKIAERIQKVMEKGVDRFESRHRRKNGSVADVEVSLQYSPIGGGCFLAFVRDITERKRIEAVLHERETRLKSISQNLEGGMIYQVVIGRDGTRRFTYLSESVRKLYGISPEEGMADSSLIYGRVHEEDIEKLLEAEEEAAKTLSTFKIEARLRDPSDEWRWSSIISVPKALDDGSTCWDGIEFVITERKQAEEAARASEERYRNLITNSAEGMFCIEFTQPIHLDDPPDIIERRIAEFAVVGEVNEALALMYRIRPQDMVGRPVRDFAPDCGKQMGDLVKTADFRIVDREEQEVAEDGSPIHIVESYFGVVENNHLLRVWGVQRNVTDQIVAREKLRESEAKFRSLAENLADVLFTTDEKGLISYISPAAEKMFGNAPSDVLGRPFFESLPADQVPFAVEQFARTVSSGERTINFSLRMKRKDGSVFPAEMSASILTKGERVVGTLGIIRDVTVRKQMEDGLQRQLRFEKGLASASACLMSTAEPDRSITEALAKLCDAAQAARVYIFENFEDPIDGLCTRQICESCAPGVHPEIDNQLLRHILYKEGFERWHATSSNRRGSSPFWSCRFPSVSGGTASSDSTRLARLVRGVRRK